MTSDLLPRRSPLTGLLVGLLLAAALLPAAPSRPPNIVLITSDNLGYGDTGVYGHPTTQTPAMDRLARQGVRFTSFYSGSPTCAVSRASLMTGRYPFRHQLILQKQGYGIGLRQSERILPHYLKPAGYVTGIFGKWNLGFDAGSRPTDRGFDEFLGQVSGNMGYYHHLYRGKHDLFQGTAELHVPGRYSTELFADSAIDFIRRHHERPFFLYLPFNAPHNTKPHNLFPGTEPVNWEVPAEFLQRYGHPAETRDEQIRYHAVVTALDHHLGRVLATLDDLGLTDNTLLIYFSDNGAFMSAGSGLGVASNAPLRDGGATVWEGGIRVPAWVRWPGVFPAGAVNHEVLVAMDLFPLILRAAGVPLPGDRVIDGRDPMEVIAGRARSPHEFLCWEYIGQRAIRRGQYKLITPARNSDAWELYDVVNDPGETRDLAPDKPLLAAALREDYLRWDESVRE